MSDCYKQYSTVTSWAVIGCPPWLIIQVATQLKDWWNENLCECEAGSNSWVSDTNTKQRVVWLIYWCNMDFQSRYRMCGVYVTLLTGSQRIHPGLCDLLGPEADPFCHELRREQMEFSVFLSQTFGPGFRKQIQTRSTLLFYFTRD